MSEHRILAFPVVTAPKRRVAWKDDHAFLGDHADGAVLAEDRHQFSKRGGDFGIADREERLELELPAGVAAVDGQESVAALRAFPVGGSAGSHRCRAFPSVTILAAPAGGRTPAPGAIRRSGIPGPRIGRAVSLSSLAKFPGKPDGGDDGRTPGPATADGRTGGFHPTPRRLHGSPRISPPPRAGPSRDPQPTAFPISQLSTFPTFHRSTSLTDET